MKAYTIRFIGIAILILSLQNSFGQVDDLPDQKKVSTDTALNFYKTGKRGIKTSNVIYYVEEDLQTVSAYEGTLVKWRVNLIKTLGEPAIGEATIRYISFDKDRLELVYGKHSFAGVDARTGAVKDEGSD